MRVESTDSFFLSMTTGVIIERLFPSTTTCPSTCRSQSAVAEAMADKQFFQQQRNQRL
jgi:hypothetical protein